MYTTCPHCQAQDIFTLFNVNTVPGPMLLPWYRRCPGCDQEYGLSFISSGLWPGATKIEG